MARPRAQDRSIRGPTCNVCMINPGVPMCQIRDRLTTPEQRYIRLRYPEVQILCYVCLQEIFDGRHRRWWQEVFHNHIILVDPMIQSRIHSTYGLQLVTIHAAVAAAIHSGSHVDGDAGDKLSLWITCYFYIQ